MLTRVLFYILLALCGAGLLLAWMPEGIAWRIFECLVFGLFLLWLLGWVAGKAHARWSWILLPLPLIALWGALQVRFGWSVYNYDTSLDVVRWGAYATLFFLAFQLAEGRERTFRRIFTVYAFFLGIVSVLQYFLGNGKIYWLFETREVAGMGPFLNRDHYASFVALAIPCAVIEMLRYPRWRWVFAIATAVLYTSVIASASRAGFILLTLDLILLFLLDRSSGRAVVAVIGLIVAFGFILGWQNLYERLQLPDPYAGRRELYAASMQMLRAQPGHGFGLGTWTQVYPAYAVKDAGVFANAAHNDWLQWGCDGGIPMMVLLGAMAGWSAVIVKRVPWSLGVPTVFIHCLIDFPMQGRFLPTVVFVVFGIACRFALKTAKPPKTGGFAPARIDVNE